VICPLTGNRTTPRKKLPIQPKIWAKWQEVNAPENTIAARRFHSSVGVKASGGHDWRAYAWKDLPGAPVK
jgi:hypothetical protein